MRRELYCLSIFFAALPVTGCAPGGSAPDGDWQITAINGESLPSGEAFVRIEDGAISGGHDGCNAWGFDRSGAQPIIVSNAQGCPGNRVMLAYAPLQSIDQTRISFARNGDELAITAGAAAFAARLKQD